MNRKAVTYHHWCGRPLNQAAHTPCCSPSYPFKDLDKQVMRNVIVIVLKSKTRNMLSSITVALRLLHAFAWLPNTDFIPFLMSFHIKLILRSMLS
eukprot:1160394-Pelagomonas_calceolata.AAC.1